MSLIAMLTVEFGGEVTETQRTLFSGELAKYDWELVEPMKATWCASCEESLTEDDAAEMAMDDVADAAEVAGIDHFNACLHFGPGSPSLFSDQDYEEAEDDGGDDQP